MGISKEEAKAVREAAKRLADGEVDEIEVGSGPTRIRIVRDPQAPMGVRTERMDGTPGFQLPDIGTFSPTTERPEKLPVWAPFLADAKGIVIPMPGPRNATMVTYMRKGPWGEDIDTLRAEMVEQGWAGGPSEPPEKSAQYAAEWQELQKKKGIDPTQLRTASEAYEQVEKAHFRYERDGRQRLLTVMHGDGLSTLILADSDVEPDES